MRQKRFAAGVLGVACAVAALPAASAEARSSRSSGVVVRVNPGARTLNIVGSHGNVKRVRLARKAPRGVRAGTKVVVAGGKVSSKGRARATSIRAKVVSIRGRKAAVATNGQPLSVVIGGTTIDANGNPVVKVTMPGTTTTPTPATCPPPAIIGTILALNRAGLKVMVSEADGTRKTFSAPAGSLDALKRGNQVLIADDNADGTLEAIRT